MTLSRLALFAARASAWALLLMGWVGLGLLAQVLAGSVLQAQALMALWLLAVGAAAAVLGAAGAVRWHGLALGLAAGVAAAGLLAAPRGGGLPALAAGMAGWAVLLAAASAVVRRCRLAVQAAGAGVVPPPVWPAATGAVIAWALVGDPTDTVLLSPRMAVSGLALAGLLGLWLSQVAAAGAPAPRAGCRAGLFDCSLPAWPALAWRDPQRWPLLLALLAMLPMMSSLPLALAACREAGWPPQAMLGLHWLAMFAPAVLMTRQRPPAWLIGGLLACALVPLALRLSPGEAMLLVTLAHGSAWSLAWRAQLAAPRAAQAPRRRLAPWLAALHQAAWVVGVGLWLAEAGPAGLLPLQAALGTAAVAALAVATAATLWRPYAGRKPSIER